MKVFLQNIRSCHNVGSIFRTADAVGCNEILIGGYTPLPENKWGVENRSMLKVSLGAEKVVKWTRVHMLGKKLDQLKSDGFVLIALELTEDALVYSELRLAKSEYPKIVLFLGNEKRGVSKQILAKMDYKIKIPMHGAKESLNVSVAFGIAAFALRDNLLEG